MDVDRPMQRLRLEDVPHRVAESFTARLFCQPSFPFLWHYHPEVEVTLVGRGRGTRFVGDSIERFGEGDLCLLGSGTPHTWRSDRVVRGEEEGVMSLVLQFLPEWWAGQLGTVAECRSIGRLLADAGPGLAFGRQTAAACEGPMRRLFDAPAGSARRVAGLIEVLSTLAEAAGPGDRRPLATDVTGLRAGREIDPLDHAAVSRVLGELHRRDGDPPTQAEAAALVNLSPPAFSRLFKRHVGKTYERYANDWRLASACRLLLETPDDITGIAYAAGFNNLSNFNRRFKAAKGMTPREYRRSAVR